MTTTTTTLQPDSAAAQDPSAAPAFRLVRRRRSGRRSHVKKIIPKRCDDDDDRGEEADEVEKKIAALQKIVPGGERLPVEDLFEETADYIFALQAQVNALRFLAAFVHTSEKKKRKLAG